VCSFCNKKRRPKRYFGPLSHRNASITPAVGPNILAPFMSAAARARKLAACPRLSCSATTKTLAGTMTCSVGLVSPIWPPIRRIPLDTVCRSGDALRGGGIHSRDGITSCVTARLILARRLVSDAVEIAVPLVAHLMPELAGSASPLARMMGLSGFSNRLNCATRRACPDRAV